MTSLNAANTAMFALVAALKVLTSDLHDGIVDPADVEDLAAQLKAQSDSLAEAITAAKSARGMK